MIKSQFLECLYLIFASGAEVFDWQIPTEGILKNLSGYNLTTVLSVRLTLVRKDPSALNCTLWYIRVPFSSKTGYGIERGVEYVLKDASVQFPLIFCLKYITLQVQPAMSIMYGPQHRSNIPENLVGAYFFRKK